MGKKTACENLLTPDAFCRCHSAQSFLFFNLFGQHLFSVPFLSLFIKMSNPLRIFVPVKRVVDYGNIMNNEENA
jgi:hypothetical protein